MCGIAGLVGGHYSTHLEAAQAMGEALAHRGPDGNGLWQGDPDLGTAATLVHLRLAIQDLSPEGQQPMVSACGRYVLVFNGEIYNQHQLRRDLEDQGHCFHSTSDTEVLLELLIRYGPSALQQLRGMYAFCLWDSHEQRAFFARDPFGIKPLYLWQGPGGELVFASEVRALLASGLIPRKLDTNGLVHFLATGHLPKLLTLVAGVHSLPPGWMAHWQAGHWHSQPHWQANYTSGLPLPRRRQKELVQTSIASSLQAHKLSDVPVALFLSSGIDSSALLALDNDSSALLPSLSIGFEEARYNESHGAAAIANHFGSPFQVELINKKTASNLVPSFLDAIDQPSVDGFNSFCISAMAKKLGFKVAISGLGGDELFGGYPSFKKIPTLLKLHRRLGILRPAAARWLEKSKSHRSLRLAHFLRNPASPTAAHSCFRGLFSPSEIDKLLQQWGIANSVVAKPWIAPNFVEPDPQPGTEDVPQLGDAIAWLETDSYMGQQLLRDSDVYSMAHGVELRLPFVDAKLFREIAQLPSPKRLLSGKRALLLAIPALRKILNKQKKQGFSFPFQAWFVPAAGSLKLGDTRYDLPSTPADLDLKPWARSWALVVLNVWLNKHLGLELGGKT